MPKKLFWGVLPLLIILLAFFIRHDQISLLLNKENGNVLTCYDCFRYALLTEWRLEGYIPPVNHLTNVPDFGPAVGFKFLITDLGIPVVKWLGLSKEFLYVVVPPLFATFFVFTLMLWVRNFAGIYAFLGGALLGVFNMIYWVRTSPGRFDTDFLILFFLFLTLWLITLLAREEEHNKSLFYALISGLSLNLFMLWYPKPIFVFLFSISLLLGLFLFKNTLKLSAVKLSIFLVASGIPNVFLGVKQLWRYIESRVLYEPSPFVPVSVSSAIAELQPLTFSQLVRLTSDNILLVVLSFAGLVYLFLSRPKYMFISLPFVAMGLSTFVAGNRMLIYLAPFLGLGLGFLVEKLIGYLAGRLSRFKVGLYLMGFLLVFLATFPPYALAVKGKLLFSDIFYEEIKALKNKLDKDSFVWTWWDFGYLIQYSLRVGTYIDNGNWHTIKLFAIAHSFLMSDEEKALNMLDYVSNERDLAFLYRGKNYKDFIKVAYEYKKPLKESVYILISPDLFVKRFIRQVGSYGTSIEPEYKTIGSDIHFCKPNGAIQECGILRYDSKRMKPIYVEGKPNRVVVYDRNSSSLLKEHIIDPSSEEILLLVRNGDTYYATYIDVVVFDTNIVKWFFLKKHSDRLEVVHDNFPLLVVYRVKI